MDVENALDLLVLADVHNAKLLKEHLMSYLSGLRMEITQKKENMEKLRNNPELMADLLQLWSHK